MTERICSLIELTAAVVAVFAGVSCTGAFYRNWADKETYGVVREKQEAVLGKAMPFTIEPGKSFRGQFPLRSARDLMGTGDVQGKPTEGEAEGASARDEKLEMPPLTPEGAVKLPLDDCMEVAMATSRQHQNEKEQLYLSALSLTLARHEWTPIFSTLVSGDVTRSGTRGNRVNTASSSVVPRVAQKILTGAEAGVSLSLNASRVVSSGSDWTVNQVASVNIVQPLLQGMGSRVAREGLKQSERNVIYAVRRYRRFQKTFVVQIVTEYFRVLQEEDRVQNQWDSYDGLRRQTIRYQFLFQEQQENKLQLGQARGRELEAYDAWLSAVQRYYSRLDAFKVRLGLEPDANIVLDRNELEKLVAKGLEHKEMAIAEAIERALAHRLDLMTSRDRVEDAKRKVYVAKHNAILPQLDLEAEYEVRNKAPNDLARFRTHEAEYSTGLQLNPGLDRKAERNDYRQALITQERRERDLDDDVDSTKLDVLQAWRSLREAEGAYGIRKYRVRVEEEKLDNARELLHVGRGVMRNVLDAEDDLLDARNSLTDAIVRHRIARLEFERDTGTLAIDDKGFLIDERAKPTEQQ